MLWLHASLLAQWLATRVASRWPQRTSHHNPPIMYFRILPLTPIQFLQSKHAILKISAWWIQRMEVWICTNWKDRYWCKKCHAPAQHGVLSQGWLTIFQAGCLSTELGTWRVPIWICPSWSIPKTSMLSTWSGAWWLWWHNSKWHCRLRLD